MADFLKSFRSLADSLGGQTGRSKGSGDSPNSLAIVLSVLGAMLIWFMISMRESYTVTRDFPIEVVNMPPDTAFAILPPPTVRVRVDGEGWQLLKLQSTNSSIRLEAGEGPIDVLAAAVRSLSPDLTARSVSPTEIQLSLEPRTRKRVPIRIRHDIETVPPYDLLGEIDVTPDSVDLSGAVSVLSELEFWPTEVLRQEGVKESFRTAIGLADTLTGLVLRPLENVVAMAEVAEFTENRRALDVIVRGAPAERAAFRLIPDKVTVRFRVPIDQYAASGVADSFYSTISYNEILADTTGRVTPTIHFPDDIVVKDLVVQTPRLQYYVLVE